MERVLSSEERIRRAEEIYNRRKMQNDVRVYSNSRNVKIKSGTDYSLFKKMILQILICLLIYFIFYLVKNSNYIFSENVMNKTKEFLNYDIDFSQVYNSCMEYYENNLKGIFSLENNKKENEIQINEQNENTIQEENTQDSKENVTEGGIGGGDINEIVADEKAQNDNESNETKEASADEENNTVPLSQMEIDANDIKSKINFILPLRGVITSRYGPRTPTDIVSANHAGIDIAANKGTVFISATDGVVTSVSGEGGYGNHVCIKNDDVMILYAHCETIYVKEGETISQGQKIGEVGETGNATGPHLHFEVRKENRTVNPEYILAFE